MSKNNVNTKVLREKENIMEEVSRVSRKAQREMSRICTHKDFDTGRLFVKQVGPDRVECKRCRTQFGLTPYPVEVIEQASRVVADQLELVRINTQVRTEKDSIVIGRLADTAASVRSLPEVIEKMNKMNERKNNPHSRGRNNDHYGNSMDAILGVSR